MTESSRHPVEPWSLREVGLDLDDLARSESLFALSNGYLGLRGNLDEGEPHGLPGTYLNGVHELRPMPYAEPAYGYPEHDQVIVNVPNGKLLRLLVEDEPFDLRQGRLHDHERELDFRSGILTRSAEWTSPTGRTVRIVSRRLVSLSERTVAAIAYEVEAVDDPVRIVVQSELVANEQLPETTEDRWAPPETRTPLVAEDAAAKGAFAVLVHTTAGSGIRLAVAMDHEIEAPVDLDVSSDAEGDQARIDVTTVLQPGDRLRLVKYLGYGWSTERSVPAVRDQAVAAVTAARHLGWDGLVAEQRAYLDDFWSHADVRVDGDPELQQAVRFALFHVLQASARAEGCGIPAKGLTGPCYGGHTFWDTETYVLPLLTHTLPRAARHALTWRHAILPRALERARQLGLAGAAFPWRTITGEESSGYWLAGTAAFHINADIADAVLRYARATGDEDFAHESGVELLVQTARLWVSLGAYDRRGRFRIDGVTGPDEYSAVADNNVYTNLMAQQNLRCAAAEAGRHPEVAARLGVDGNETQQWEAAAAAMYVPYDDDLGVHPQADGFTEHAPWDFAATRPESYPLYRSFPYFDLYRKQVVKQADLVLAMHLRGDAFSTEQKRRNFDYYEGLTVRDSSLSACTQAVVAAEVGHVGLAYDYAREAAMVDLRGLRGDTDEGLHVASLAGAWMALVAGFGGLRDEDMLRFDPRLPAALDGLAFSVVRGESRLHVEIGRHEVTYRLTGSQELAMRHAGEEVLLRPGEPQTRRLSDVPKLDPPEQPYGRRPPLRRPEG